MQKFKTQNLKLGRALFSALRYLNNYRVRGKEYYKNGKLKYEGEYLFNNKWNGKFYDYDGNIIIEYNNGKGNGTIEINDKKMTLFKDKVLEEEKICDEISKGKEYDIDGRLLFVGEFLNKEKWKGKIKEYYKDEVVFEGELLDGNIYSGKGKNYNSEGIKIFEGEYINGKINGYAKKI